VIQLPFNLLDQRQEACFAEASEKGIGIMVRSVLLKGLLSDRGKHLHPALTKVEEHIERYHTIIDTSFTGLPAFATKFALSFPEISSVLVGIDKVEYLHQSLAAVNGRYLDEKTMLQARALAYPEPAFLNLAQWSKNGWLA
jgi:aryl-alcohol dehydrogenase-like predicted oxidoreductase